MPRTSLLALLALAGCVSVPPPPAVPFVDRDLVQELGYPPGTKLLIVNADDAGLCGAVNDATVDVLAEGLATSATVLVTAPRAEAFIAAARERGLDVGVHLCLNAGWGGDVRLAPVLPADQVPSLVRSDGTFHESVFTRELNASASEAAAELRAQVRRAIDLGLDPTHLDGHLGCTNYRPDLREAGLDAAVAFRLPLRHVLFTSEARRRGIVCPDRFAMFYDTPVAGRRDAYRRFVASLEPGVTELAIHVARDTPEWRSIDPAEHAFRTSDREIFLDPGFRRALDDAGVVLIGWRPLRDLTRRWLAEIGK